MARGLAVIKAFDEDHQQLTLSEVAGITGLARAAARRFLLTLAELGYVRTDGRMFTLTPRVLELGYAYLSSLSLPQIAEPHLERMVAEVQESASVTVLDDTDIVYVARVPTSRIMRVTISIGTRFPAYADVDGPGAAGRADRSRAGRLPRPGQHAPDHRAHRSPTPARCAPSSTGSASRAGRWWTRNSRSACGRWPRRSATARAGSPPRPTSPPTPPGPAPAEARRTLLPVLLRTVEQIGADLRAAESPAPSLMRLR